VEYRWEKTQTEMVLLFEKQNFEVSLWEKIKYKIIHFSIGPVSIELPI
jgi:hypothetical protein